VIALFSLVRADYESGYEFGAYGYDSVFSCTTVAALFDSTCGGTAVSLSTMTSANVNCLTDVGVCAGTGTETDCTFARKLCVTCSGSTVRVQTNGFPNHCYKAILNAPQSTVIDFEVTFNPDVYITTTS